MTSKIIDTQPEAASARTLLSAAAVRRIAHRMLALALNGSLEDWSVDLDRLSVTADFVTRVVRARYPRLDIPVHARWRHFVFDVPAEAVASLQAVPGAGSSGRPPAASAKSIRRDLWRETATSRPWPNPAVRARAEFDLAITSVLLDAGAGPGWQYHDAITGLTAMRSEGLALASLRWFERGGLSAQKGEPLRVDASVLEGIQGASLRDAFQATPTNPLLGLEGRAALLNRLGAAVRTRPDLFAIADAPRPGGLFDALVQRAAGKPLPAAIVLETLLDAFGSIWQHRPTLGGVALGDCWPHPALTGPHPADGYVPLHKLSQWLAYSLLEPLQSAGVAVSHVEELTGLAEYRNGGLFVDMGVLVPNASAAWTKIHSVGDPFVVGWRSLTVALLDRIAPLVSARLGLDPDSFPLPRVLEGGTWAAGRIIARDKRADGGPPLQISSDGTVF